MQGEEMFSIETKEVVNSLIYTMKSHSN